jgi:Putative phage tail protein
MPAIGAAIGAIFTTVGTAFAAGGFFTTVIGRLLLSVALSALQAALVKKPREPGIKTKVTQTGGMNPQAFPLLKYATAGTHVCPPMSHGVSGKTPNAYLTFVVLLSDVPGCTISRVMINNQYVTLGAAHPDYGPAVTSAPFSGYAWVKFYDGSQTTADAMLLAKYGSYPERPWTSDMIGRGTAYAIVTFLYNRSVFPGLPRVKFEMNGIPLYDPRKDSTVGGSGAHRWANKATWEQTVNPMVGIYNVMRGISLTDGSTYGGNFPDVDLPLASVFTAMNECDLTVSTGSGTEPQYRAGIEVTVDEEPADIVAELLKACTGQVAEIGGLWKFRVGPPGIPAFAMTDADIVISKDQNFRPFPNFASSYNGAQANYPEPANVWEPKDAPPYYNATYEAQDQGQRLVADLNLVAVPYAAQVRRLMYAGVEEERRFRRHEATLPPDYAQMEPLDSLSWTSTENGYTSKVFEIAGLSEDPMTGLLRPMLRERDSADFSYPALPPPATVSILPVIPAAQTVPNFAVAGSSILDATGVARRPALSLTWEPDLPDVTGIMWEVRVQATAVVVARGSTHDVASGGLLVSDGVVSSTTYEVRAQPVVDRDRTWTSWIAATTPSALIKTLDMEVGSVTDKYSTGIVWPTGSAAAFSSISSPTTIVGPDVPAPNYFWVVTIDFEISRVAGSGGQFTVELRETAFIGANGPYTTVLQTFNVMTDGVADGPPDPGPDGGGYMIRWFATIRGGNFTTMRWDARITKTSSPTGKIRNLKVTANRLLR